MGAIVAKLAGKGFYLDGTGATRVTVDGKVKELMATMTGARNMMLDTSAIGM